MCQIFNFKQGRKKSYVITVVFMGEEKTDSEVFRIFKIDQSEGEGDQEALDGFRFQLRGFRRREN